MSTIPTPFHLDPAVLQGHLDSQQLRAPLHYFAEIDSTNSEAERLLLAGKETPQIVLASQQTAGRGRRGNAWYSQDLGNLYLSVLLFPNRPPEQMQRFTLWMGLQLCDLLNTQFELPLSVKWPNDLLHQNKKVAGMLTEARIENDLTQAVIFGLGININSDTQQWPDALKNTASSLATVAGHRWDIHEIASALIGRIFKAYQSYVSGDYGTQFDAQWEQWNGIRNRVITVSTQEKHYTGIAQGVTSDGALLLETENGAVLPFQAGDVTLHRTYQP